MKTILLAFSLAFLANCAGSTVVAGPEYWDKITREHSQDFLVSYKIPNGTSPSTTDTKFYRCNTSNDMEATDAAERMGQSYCEKEELAYHDSETGYVSSMAAPMLSGVAAVGTGYLMRNIGQSSNTAEGGDASEDAIGEFEDNREYQIYEVNEVCYEIVVGNNGPGPRKRINCP